MLARENSARILAHRLLLLSSTSVLTVAANPPRRLAMIFAVTTTVSRATVGFSG
jgi:hypothetical protein